jgi:hypothetical protein
MIRRRLGIPFAVGAALALTAQLFGDSGNNKLIHVTTTQQVPFQAGGTVHVNHSYGQLWVEGWDRPEVELTVTKSPDALYDAKDQAKDQAKHRAKDRAKDQAEATRLMENVHVTAERRSDTDLEISTSVGHFSRWRHPFGPVGGVMLEYRIRVPRNSKLVIHHDNGEVLVSNMTADIEATGHAGDIVVLLPETGKYSIDAKSKFGTLSSDFDGDFRHKLASSQYAKTAPAPAQRIYLRIGRGGISIKGSPPEAQPRVSSFD